MRRVLFLIVLLIVVSFPGQDTFSQYDRPIVRGQVFFQNQYGDRYPGDGAFVRLCTRDRRCGNGAWTNRYGQFFLYDFPRGEVVLEVFPRGPGGDFVYYYVFVGNNRVWTLPSVTVLMR